MDDVAVKAKWGVMPSQIGDVLALMGDASDNIKGVDGIGPKTAADLIRKHLSLMTLLSYLDCQTKLGKKEQAILDASTRLGQNLEMTRLETDLPLPVPLDELTLGRYESEFYERMAACDINAEKL